MRAFREKATGKWLGRLDKLYPEPPVAEHIAHVAAEYEVDPKTIECVEVESDPRNKATMMIPPTVSYDSVLTDSDRIAALEAKVAELESAK